MTQRNLILNRKPWIILLLSAIILIGASQTTKAAEITSATLNEETYLAGKTGYVSVDIYNDKNANITVTELSATIDYYYSDGTVYVQKFFTDLELTDVIAPGEAKTYQIALSLPTNIAPGYINLIVRGSTDLWINELERWIHSDSIDHQVKMYVESPYKQSYEDTEQQLQDSEEQLQNVQDQIETQESANRSLSVYAILLGVSTLTFAAMVVVLMLMLRKAKPAIQPPP